MAATVASSTPASAPRQPACAAPTTPPKDRRRARGRSRRWRRRARARRARDHARRRAGARRGQGRSTTTTSGEWTWWTVTRRLVAKAQRPRHAAPVLDHARRIVAEPRPPLRRGVDALRHAALAGEEGVPDGGGELSSGAWISMADHAASGLCPSRAIAKPASPARPGSREGEDLEQLAHAAAPRRSGAQRRVDGRGLRRRRARASAPRARRRCRAPAGSRPASSARTTAAPPARAARASGEIDMGGQVGLARLGERVDEGVAPHRLQRVAEAGASVAVVDDAAPRRPARTIRLARRSAISAAAASATRASRRRARRPGEAGSGSGARPKARPPSPSSPTRRSHQPSRSARIGAPAARRRTRWRRAAAGPPGSSDELVVPGDRERRPGQRCACCCAQRPGWSRPDERCSAARKAGAARVAARSSIGHQRAAAGPELDQAKPVRRAHLRPRLDAPQPDQLAEHLADLGRGDEIAAPRPNGSRVM